MQFLFMIFLSLASVMKGNYKIKSSDVKIQNIFP